MPFTKLQGHAIHSLFLDTFLTFSRHFLDNIVLRDLGAQQRRALGLFLRMKEVTRNDVAKFFKLPARQAYLLCQRWLKSGFLVIGNPSTKSRTYRLAEQYEILLIDQQHDAPGQRRLK